MGVVASIEEARARRAARRRSLAVHAAMHPALRWVSGDGAAAHRRAVDGRTACGMGGPLLLADPAAILCTACYPSRRTGT